MSSDLNKKLFEIIENETSYSSFENHPNYYQRKAADECEKICLQAQIDLLNDLNEGADIFKQIAREKENLQQQLKTIDNNE